MSELDFLHSLLSLHNDVLDNIMKFITNLGDAGIIWIVIAIILLFMKKTRKCGIMMLVSMGIGLIIGNGFIKNWIQRPRPYWIDSSLPLLIPELKDYSFPSGHTLASFEAAITIFLHNKKWGIAAIIVSLIIGFSRMYFFVHFPTDVLGGAILGTIIALVVYYTYELIKNRARKDIKESK